ncbi:cAMP-binding protein [Caenispirillum salinarum AK4]|uniref:cAMP-binding protein n=2 Tax=Caenispirillum TaxID=414051 RepID=K9HJF0_9PROT|nr:cAMP-binding protein [Caenispirillum salinarum AK4]
MKGTNTMTTSDSADAAPGEYSVEGRRTVPRGDLLFKEGDAADCAYIVEEGLLEISRAWNGADVIIGTAGPNEMVGEMALIDKAPRSATARAIRDTTLLVVPFEQFEWMLEDTNPVVRRLLERFVAIIRNVNDTNLRLTLGIR